MQDAQGGQKCLFQEKIKLYGLKLKLWIVPTLLTIAFFTKELTQMERLLKVRNSLTSDGIKLGRVNNGGDETCKGNESKAATMYQNGVKHMVVG